MEFLLLNKEIKRLENELVMIAYNLNTNPVDLVNNVDSYSVNIKNRIINIVSSISVHKSFLEQKHDHA